MDLEGWGAGKKAGLMGIFPQFGGLNSINERTGTRDLGNLDSGYIPSQIYP